jgi:hypothetical protein
MIGILVLLWVGAVAVGALSAWMCRRVPLPPFRARLALALAAPSAAIAFFVATALKGLLVAVPVSVFFVSFVVLVSEYAWLVDRFTEERLQRLLGTQPHVRERLERHPLLGRLMRMRRP